MLRQLTVHPLARKAAAEFVGTALLLIAVVGSGIAAQRLSPGNIGLELLENALATGAALAAIIIAVGSVSGAHLNPVVSIVDAAFGGLSRRELGRIRRGSSRRSSIGRDPRQPHVLAARSDDLDARRGRLRGSGSARSIATFGLLLVIFGAVRSSRAGVVPFAVGAYITGAYFFTSSTSFANPAVTVARELSNTFAGISPGSVLPFIAAQLIGAGLAWLIVSLLFPRERDVAHDVVVAH